MIILIPAYEPDHALIDLVDALSEHRIVVVDDGSGGAWSSVFAALEARGVDVITHADNLGKAAALRTGFAHIARSAPNEAVVCADSDGQHRPDDIVRVALELDRHGPAIVLGARDFTGQVPLRSRVGNAVTRSIFAWVTGRSLRDTQTGLRGYRADQLDWLQSVSGERFAYEQQVLVDAVRQGRTILEVDIATVYLEHNDSSHFRPVRDSWAVYQPLIRQAYQRVGRFTVSSVGAWGVDVTLFIVLTLVGVALPAALLVSRSVSAAVNFMVNRTWVFGGPESPPLLGAMIRYGSLAVVNVAAAVAAVGALVGLGVSVVPAKIASDLVLFLGSFGIQRYWWSRPQLLTGADVTDAVPSRTQGLALAPTSEPG